MTEELIHFFIRSASTIHARVYEIQSCLKNVSSWQSKAEDELRDLNAIRTQFLLVAQVLDGQDVDSFKLEDALGCKSDIDREVFEAALDAANIVRVQNEDVPGVLVVTNDSMSKEDIDKLREFCESQLSGTMKRIEIKEST